MRGNSHVRFGAGDEETCPGNGERRFIPTLPANPAELSLLNRATPRPPLPNSCNRTRTEAGLWPADRRRPKLVRMRPWPFLVRWSVRANSVHWKVAVDYLELEIARIRWDMIRSLPIPLGQVRG
jgi:hypothetical protein